MDDLDKAVAEATNSQKKLEIRKQELLDTALNATIVLIDLTNSTGLKKSKPFPEWVEVMEHFYEQVSSEFKLRKWQPVKFLGDALLFFYPDHDDEHSKRYLEKRRQAGNGLFPSDISFLDILQICDTTKNNWWNAYKGYLKFPVSRENFLSITIAVDYGAVIDFNLTQAGQNPDPLGECVDRCFRISSAAGPGQILISRDFQMKLRRCKGFDGSELKKRIIPIAVSDDFLKGVEPQGHVYYLAPGATDEIRWTLHKKNRTLIEETSRPMVHKAKLKLLRREVDTLKGQLENKGE